MATGKVKWFDEKKGFGFIEREDGNDIFVHTRAIRSRTHGIKTLLEGELVKFDITDAMGIQADNVQTLYNK